uniref:Uncharacterized protein n=1 Tax=Vitis vinifera TaxID=29760 RepID=A5BWL9_VITVI|nr:hypothetical protein VITISV_015073 [Vitis vinifera]
MNFMSYVAEVSRGWDEPNARDMGRMTSQPNAKGEMYIWNDNIDMKANVVAMARRLEELEMKKMQEVQAISQTPLQPMPCSICRSFEHLVDECPTIPMVGEMFGDCNTYNSNWRDHPNFSWKPQLPQYKQHVQALPQASNLEQTMVNLNKVVGDFVGAQKSINAQLGQRIDSVESSLNKKMDGVQNDLSQKIDNLQYSISRGMSKKCERRKLGIKRSSKSKERAWAVKFRSKNELLRNFAAKVSCCENGFPLRNGFAATHPPLRKFSQLRRDPMAHECHFAAKYTRFTATKWMRAFHALRSSVSQPKCHFEGCFTTAKPPFGTRVPFRSPVHSFRSCEMVAKSQHLKILQRAHHELTCCSRTPISATVGHISITSRSSFHTYHMLFQSLGSQQSRASNGARCGVETKNLWPFEDDCAKLNGYVAPAPHFATVGHVFGALSRAQIMYTICRFEA